MRAHCQCPQCTFRLRWTRPSPGRIPSVTFLGRSSPLAADSYSLSGRVVGVLLPSQHEIPHAMLPLRSNRLFGGALPLPGQQTELLPLFLNCLSTLSLRLPLSSLRSPAREFAWLRNRRQPDPRQPSGLIRLH